MKRNGHRVIRELDAWRERRVVIQRFVCLSCGRSYSLRGAVWRRYSEAFAAQVVRRHVEGESYRVIARDVYRWSGRKISPTSLSQMVLACAARCKSAWEMSRELHPRWEGFLVLDEKMVSVQGRQQWFYGAFDVTGDVVHWQAVSELRVDEAIDFLEQIKDLGYRCGGITTDMDTVLTRAVEEVYTEKPHQYCLKHALNALDKLLGYKPLTFQHKRTQAKLREEFDQLRVRKGGSLARAQGTFLEHWKHTRGESMQARVVRLLHEACHDILFAKTEVIAAAQLTHLRQTRSAVWSRKWKAVRFLERHWDRLMMHHRVKGLPRTNNMAESFNKQLQRRLKTIESFQHRSTAISYMNLLVAYLRFKPYTDCRGSRKHLNGKNRLQAAGVRHLSKDWLSTCLKHPEFGNR